ALVQILLGYSATDAGLIITPGGFLVMLMLPIVGRLVAKVDPRWLLALGLITMSAGLFHVSGLALNADHAAFVWARIYQIAGVAFLFVPTNAVAYVNIPAERMNAASALVNLSRMLGGSVGIALAVAWLERSAAAARSRLAERLNEFDPAFGAARDNLAMLFSTTGADPVEAQMKALGLIGRELARQAGMLAYLEDFRLMALLPLLVLPLIPLLRRTAGQAAH
ncbi:MAG: multidrug efflux MFS transporter, partial [Alphaproteobacteria bacterium]|nr:multidrug efflux MFS transporter [Alphaproteobacteria bacterium]